MGCGCNSNFSGETFSENRYKPYRTKNQKMNASGKMNLSQRIKNNNSRFNSFMGFSSRQTPIVNTKKYGVPDEYYYEFNTSSGRSPINRNDMNVEF